MQILRKTHVSGKVKLIRIDGMGGWVSALEVREYKKYIWVNTNRFNYVWQRIFVDFPDETRKTWNAHVLKLDEKIINLRIRNIIPIFEYFIVRDPNTNIYCYLVWWIMLEVAG